MLIKWVVATILIGIILIEILAIGVNRARLMFPVSFDQKSQTLEQLCQQKFNTSLKHSDIQPSRSPMAPIPATDNIITIYCEVK